MAVTAQQVKELRELTDCGIMDCKKALIECDGDIEKAKAWLREKGMAKAEKKSARIAAEGAVVAKIADDLYEVQVVSWYDNENSYTSQMVRTIKYFAELG